MLTDIPPNVTDPPATSKKCFFHELWVGDRLLRSLATRSVLSLFRKLSGHGVPAENFSKQLQDVSTDLFGDPQVIHMGTPLRFVHSNGEVQLATLVGSALLSLSDEEPTYA